tara:strand:- start:3872 stop:4099 length:228 start_codon:yes stop_codon:yes gene_type:complete
MSFARQDVWRRARLFPLPEEAPAPTGTVAWRVNPYKTYDPPEPEMLREVHWLEAAWYDAQRRLLHELQWPCVNGA